MTSKAKFTKGPWQPNVWTNGRRSIVAGIPRHRPTSYIEVAEVWPCQDEDEYKANMNLIAAATEMYDALEWLMASRRVPDSEAGLAAENKGATALSKARGES